MGNSSSTGIKLVCLIFPNKKCSLHVSHTPVCFQVVLLQLYFPKPTRHGDSVRNDSCSDAEMPGSPGKVSLCLRSSLDNCFSPSFDERRCYGLNIYVSAQILMLKFWPCRMIIFTGRVFGRCLSCQGGILMNGIQCPIQPRGCREIPLLLPPVQAQLEGTSYDPGRGSLWGCDHSGILMVDL